MPIGPAPSTIQWFKSRNFDMPTPTEIGGIPFAEIRDALRLLKRQPTVFDGTAVLTADAKMSAAKARRFVRALENAGLISPVSGAQGTMHQLSNAGSQMATKRLRRISPARKDQLIQAVLARVQEIATRPDFAFEVKLLILFGSALHDLQDYGDVDLALSIDFKATYPDRDTALEAEQDLTGIPYYDLNRGLPDLRIMRFLRARSSFIHLHVLSTERSLSIPHRVLYQRP
jgi:hypothetical protein